MPAPGCRDFRSSCRGSRRRSGRAPNRGSISRAAASSLPPYAGRPPAASQTSACPRPRDSARRRARRTMPRRAADRAGVPAHRPNRWWRPHRWATSAGACWARKAGAPDRAKWPECRMRLNHNIARVGRSRRHQGDPTTPRLDLRPHPFGAATGLAKATPCHQQPYPPGSCGRQLFGPDAIAPIVFKRVGFARRHRADQRVDLGFWQIGELFEQGGGHLFVLLFFAHPDPVDLVDQPLPRIVDEKRFVVLVGRLVHHRLFPAHPGFGVEDRRGHADLFAFDCVAKRRLFAEDRAEDKIADQRVDLGSTARELGCEGPRQRHRGHRLLGPRVGDRLANPVFWYSQGLHQLNLTALVLGRLKLRLPAAPLLAHFGSRYVANIKISAMLDSFDWTSDRTARTRSDPVGVPIGVDACGVGGGGALQCKREFRAAYERWADLCLNSIIVN